MLLYEGRFWDFDSGIRQIEKVYRVGIVNHVGLDKVPIIGCQSEDSPEHYKTRPLKVDTMV